MAIFCCCIAACVSLPTAIAASVGTYEIFPQPNYARYLPQTVSRVLNDGKYVSGTMWMANGGVAWQDSPRVSVMLDLGSEIPLEAVGFHGAARRAAGVEFPDNAFVYLSGDGESFLYGGDAMGGASGGGGAYREQLFLAKGIGRMARYVRIEFFVRGRYFAMDEIEIVRGGTGRALFSDLRKAEIEHDARRRASLTRYLQITEREMAALDREGAPAGKSPIERRSAMLAERFSGREFLLANASFWASDLGQALPIGGENHELRIGVPVGGCDYRAFALSNPSSIPVSLRLSQAMDGSRMKAELREALLVTAATLDKVFDPLVEVDRVLPLKSGESRILMLKLCGGGTHQFTVSGERSTVVARTVVQEVDIGQLSLPMAGVAWAYLDEGILHGRSEAARSDLRSHYVDVLVIPPSALPAYDANDFSYFLRTLARSSDARRVLLFLNFRQRQPRLADPVWREAFVRWYARIVESARRAGIDEKAVILYPYDEPSGLEIPAAEAFYAWVRAALPGVKLFSTIDRQEALPLLPLLDIACVTRKIAPQVPVSGEVWLYDVQGPGKANPPYAYYRLLPWEAYSRGMQGAGFWSYGDIYGSAWDDFDGKRPDYGVVYEGKGADELISSRRWEAWRMGMEDVRVLKTYAARFGDAAVKRQVRKVLEMPGDLGRADAVRQQLLRELAVKH